MRVFLAGSDTVAVPSSNQTVNIVGKYYKTIITYELLRLQLIVIDGKHSLK